MCFIEREILALFSEDSAVEVAACDKRDFLMEKVGNGEPVSNSKTPWTEKGLQNKLCQRYQNP